MNVVSLVLTLLIAIPVGIVSACRQDSLLDKSVTVLVFLGFAMPSFWLALLLMMFFGIELQWLPISGLTSMNYEQLSAWGKFCDLARHLALPTLVYTVGGLAGMSRYMRACMLEVLGRIIFLPRGPKGLARQPLSGGMPCATPCCRSLPCLVFLCRGSLAAVLLLNQFLPCRGWGNFFTAL